MFNSSLKPLDRLRRFRFTDHTTELRLVELCHDFVGSLAENCRNELRRRSTSLADKLGGPEVIVARRLVVELLKSVVDDFGQSSDMIVWDVTRKQLPQFVSKRVSNWTRANDGSLERSRCVFFSLKAAGGEVYERSSQDLVVVSRHAVETHLNSPEIFWDINEPCSPWNESPAHFRHRLHSRIPDICRFAELESAKDGGDVVHSWIKQLETIDCLVQMEHWVGCDLLSRSSEAWETAKKTHRTHDLKSFWAMKDRDGWKRAVVDAAEAISAISDDDDDLSDSFSIEDYKDVEGELLIPKRIKQFYDIAPNHLSEWREKGCPKLGGRCLRATKLKQKVRGGRPQYAYLRQDIDEIANRKPEPE
jgi:hypothetical protein